MYRFHSCYAGPLSLFVSSLHLVSCVDCAYVVVFGALSLYAGCNKDYLSRTFFLYDGVHYDPLVFKQADGRLRYKFSTDDDQYTLLALDVAKEAHKVSSANATSI